MFFGNFGKNTERPLRVNRAIFPYGYELLLADVETISPSC